LKLLNRDDSSRLSKLKNLSPIIVVRAGLYLLFLKPLSFCWLLLWKVSRLIPPIQDYVGIIYRTKTDLVTDCLLGMRGKGLIRLVECGGDCKLH